MRGAVLIVLVLLASPVAGQGKDPGVAPASEPPAMALTVDKGRMTVPVSVDGRGPYPFVIDTGAERSVVSRELAATLRLPASRRARLYDFVGASLVDTVRVPSLSVSTLGSTAIDAPSLALANIGAPGMLGIDALQGHKLAIDFGRKRMTVMPAIKHAKGDMVVKAHGRQGQLIVTDARFQGQPIAVIIDTGSWVSVGNPAMLALAARTPRRLGQVSVTAVTGRTFDADFFAVNNLTVGNVRFDNVGLSFADVAPFARFGLKDTPALILGMSSLRLFHRVELDFVNREVAFTLPQPPIDFSNVCRGASSCRSYP